MSSGDTVVRLPAWKHDPLVPSSSLKMTSTNLGSWQSIVAVFRSFWNIDGVWLSAGKMRCYSLWMLFVLSGLWFPLEFVLGRRFFLPPCVFHDWDQVSCWWVSHGAIYGSCVAVTASCVFVFDNSPISTLHHTDVIIHFTCTCCFNLCGQYPYICSTHTSWQYLNTASYFSVSLFVYMCLSPSLFLMFVAHSAENVSVAMETNPKGKSWGWISFSLLFPSFVSCLVAM